MAENPNKKPTPPDSGGSDRPTGGAGYPKSLMIWAIFIGLAVILFWFLARGYSHAEHVTYDQFLKSLRDGNVKSVKLGGDGEVTGRYLSTEGMRAGASSDFVFRYPPAAYEELIREVKSARQHSGESVGLDYDPDDNLFVKVLLTYLPWVVLFAIMWFIVMRILRGAGGAGSVLGNFGRSRHRVTTKEHTNITFADVAGVDEAKEEVQEIIAFLKSPKKFQRLGGRIPRGVLLVGSPGTGKTLLAKAIAGEADVPFFSISGSDFVEMFVGVGASRVRDLFKQAKDNAPCIIFLDEIDAVGRRRGGPGFNGGGHDEREQTLNAILVEMDGFETSDQVIVIAATNRADVLDPALTRPGRFDRQIQVPLPDIQGRLEILKVHARKVRLGPDADLHRLARGTPMFSGADLAAIINEAAIAAAMADKDCVDQSDLEEARDKVRWGRARRSRAIDERERVITAHHEAGHALASCLLPDAEPLHKVSIIPRGPALGATFQLPEKDRHIYTRSKILAEIMVAFAGRVAEKLLCDDISSGAAEDIRRATALARVMICDWGMSQALGPVRYARDDDRLGWDLGAREYSEQTAQAIDAEVRSILGQAYEHVERMLSENREKLEAVARSLLKYETLSAEEVHKLISGQTLDRPTVGDLLAAEQARRPAPAAEPQPGQAELPGRLGPGPLPQPG